MSPVDRIQAAKAGDTFKGDKIVGNVSAGQITADVRAVSQAGAVTFDVTYLGIKLAAAACKVVNGKQIWTEAK